LLGLSWCEWQRQGVEQRRAERVLFLTAMIVLIDLGIADMGPEEAARLVSAVTNERLKAHRPEQ
jgi:hypothetical protein